MYTDDIGQNSSKTKGINPHGSPVEVSSDCDSTKATLLRHLCLYAAKCGLTTLGSVGSDAEELQVLNITSNTT